ncbi:MAG: hypothetical protein IV100_14570 [Myxococcales bacterium]|nr:hypothetical protein [Myxococcales bacterium]
MTIQRIFVVSLAAACVDLPPVIEPDGPGYPKAALTRVAVGDGLCTEQSTDPTPKDLCEWFGGFDAVIGGVIRSVRLVDRPHASLATPDPIDDAPCAGSVSRALELQVDVTHVYVGDVPLGRTTVLIGSSQVEQMTPHPFQNEGGSLSWDSAKGETAYHSGTWVGLPVMRVAGRGYAVVSELPFTAGTALDVRDANHCGSYPRPTNLNGLSYLDFVAAASTCAPEPSLVRERRRQVVDGFPQYAYAANCHAVTYVPECVVEEDCSNGTTCVDSECVQETSPPGPPG